MKTSYIDIDNNMWGVLVIYDFDETDTDELAGVMESFGVRQRDINRAIRILSTYNSGMAISKDSVRMSAIFVGKPTSIGQFWNTVSHELHHVATAITDYYGEDYDGEPSAYLHGYLLQKVVEQMAVPCSENEKDGF